MAGGPAHQGGLDPGVGVGAELAPQGTTRIVEAHETPGELLGPLGVVHPARRAGQLVGLAHAPVHRRFGQGGVGLGRGDGGHRGEHVEGEASGAKRSAEFGEPIQLLSRHHQGAGRGGAQPTAVGEPRRHGQGPVAPEGLGGAELGDLAHHGPLVLRDSALVRHHALGQSGGAGVAAPIAAEGPGAHTRWSRGAFGRAGRHGASMREGCVTGRYRGRPDGPHLRRYAPSVPGGAPVREVAQSASSVYGPQAGRRPAGAPGVRQQQRAQSACTDRSPAQARSAMRCASRATSSSTPPPPLDPPCSMNRRLAPSAIPTTA